MPFKHYIQRIEGKNIESFQNSVVKVCRYLSSHGGWRYGVVVTGVEGAYGEPLNKWACWENSLKKAIKKYYEAIESENLKPLFHPQGGGWMTYTSQEVEEIDYAI